jgi:hypothetical protein
MTSLDPNPPEVTETTMRRPQRLAVVGASVLALVAVTVALLAVVGGPTPSEATPTTSTVANTDAAYRTKLTAVLDPVLRENQRVSNALARLSGTKVTNARAAVSQARHATTLAQGAVGAMSAPSEAQPLATAITQFLDREAAYLAAVATVLSNPRSSSVAELRTLQSNLTSAIIATGPPIATSAKGVSGAGAVTSWAARTKRTLARRAREKRARQPERAAARRTTATASTPGTPAVATSACDQNISAGGGAGCDLASNVFWEYWSSTTSGGGTSFAVYDPGAYQGLTVTCAGSAPVTCTTSAGGVVTFPIAAVNAYTVEAATNYAITHNLGHD